MLRSRAAHSSEAEYALGYNLACYECLTGNLEEAKIVIKKHLESCGEEWAKKIDGMVFPGGAQGHPEKKENALKDDDLAAIRDFIETL